MRALVVEDDKDLNRQLAAALADAGFAVDTAADGEEGYFLGDTEPYDVVIWTLACRRSTAFQFSNNGAAATARCRLSC